MVKEKNDKFIINDFGIECVTKYGKFFLPINCEEDLEDLKSSIKEYEKQRKTK